MNNLKIELGKVYTWGEEKFGCLGWGNHENKPKEGEIFTEPRQIILTSMERVVDAAVGESHVVVVTESIQHFF